MRQEKSRFLLIGMNHEGKKWDTFLFRGSDSKLRGRKFSKSSGHFDCGERYNKRSRTTAKPEHKHDYTNAMFKHVFVILCARVRKHNFRYWELQQLIYIFQMKDINCIKIYPQ